MLRYRSLVEPSRNEERNRDTVNMGHSTLTGDERSTGSGRGRHEREDERPSNDEDWKGRRVVKVDRIFFTPDQITTALLRIR